MLPSSKFLFEFPFGEFSQNDPLKKQSTEPSSALDCNSPRVISLRNDNEFSRHPQHLIQFFLNEATASNAISRNHIHSKSRLLDTLARTSSEFSLANTCRRFQNRIVLI